jgi:formylglycine-generating enzyme required for sulfatase activity
MALAITLVGIDRAISNLNYKNKNTLKYRYVQHIRQYYTTENAVVSLNEIDHEALIKILWDSDHRHETIKNKRKNLNSLRSSVNTDFKKLYEKGENPEGIKIGSNNIFAMSEDAKDKILKKIGYDLQPDGTLNLDQIMDILKVANEAVSGSMAVEDTEKKDGLKKIDRLKDLIKGLSEKVGLGQDQTGEGIVGKARDQVESSGTGFESGDKKSGEGIGGDLPGKGDEDGTGSSDTAEILDDALMDEIDELEEIADLKDEVEVVDDIDDEVMLDDVEDEVEVVDDIDDKEMLDNVEDVEIAEISDTKTDELVEASGIEEELEDALDEEGAELDDIEDIDDVEEIIEDDISEEVLDESGPGVEDSQEGTGPGQGLGLDKIDKDIGGGAADQVKSAGTGFEPGDKEDGEGGGGDIAGKGDEDGEEQKGNDQLGLPVGSLGQEYSLEADGKIEKDKLLAEEFDGYLGSMERYYNHYVMIPGGEYLIGSKHPKKDERPEQTLYLEPYYIGRYPITNGLFEIFIEKTGYKTTAEKVGYGTVYYGRFEKKKDTTTGLITSTWNASLYCKTVEGACWYRPSGPESTLYHKRNHPVVQISMEDAMAFATWTGKRLPTENEWESASRTANGWIFPWGPEWKNDACNIEDSCIADTTPVDKYVEFGNDFGIVDTLGNVLEWTTDRFDSTSKSNNGEKYRVVRGGSWISGNDVRLFSRFIIQPESHSNILGFRCVAY